MTVQVDYEYSDILDMIRLCVEEHGKCSPRLFDEMDDTCSSSQVMRRFGSWTTAKVEAGVAEPGDNPKQEYTDDDLLEALGKLYEREGKTSVGLLQKHEDLPSSSAVVARFGSWSAAKEQAGLLPDQRANNSGPRQYSDDDYLQALRDCQEKHGKVTQAVFNEDDEFPSAAAVRRRFDQWSTAKEKASVTTGPTRKYTDEELLNILRELAEEIDGTISANKLAATEDTPSPETFQRRFGGWSDAKEEAGVK